MSEIGKEMAQELLNIVKGTKAFVIEQAPDVLRQLVAWQTAEDAFCLIASIVALVGALAIGRWVYRNWKSAKEFDKSDWVFGGGFITCASILGSGAAVIINMCNLLKVTLAPKIYLLEYLTKLAR